MGTVMTWNNSVIPAEEELETKQLHVLGLWAPKTIRKAPAVESFMTAFMDCVECHYHAYKEGGVLHQDLRENNLMFEYGDHGHIRGVLNDWDLASCVDEHGGNEVTNATPKRIGTIPFMARDLLVDDTPPPHLYRHDLESFFYILVWAAVNDNFGADEPRKIDLVIASEWDDDTLRRAKAHKTDFICNPSTKKMIIQRVQPTCSVLLPWIDSLWSLFFEANIHYSQNYKKLPKDWDYATVDGRITFETFMEAINRSCSSLV
ncbi:hypothetical protein H0H93_006079 [Arthromyces matolae]|nr:hypothetical protein H0H93_006079 [Arthromyces matolae]